MRYVPSVIPTIIGILVLSGWYWNIEFLTKVDSQLVPMNPVTALGIVLSGISLTLRVSPKCSRLMWRLGCGIGIVILLVSSLKLIEIALGWETGIDTWLFRGQPFLKMAPDTTVNFFMLGTAIVLLYSGRGVLIAQLIAATVVMTSILALVGYSYGIREFYDVGMVIPMALNTATSFLLLAAAALFVAPDQGLMAIITNDGPAGKMARILIPCAILIPIAMGWLGLTGQRKGLFQYEFGTALFVMSNVFVFVLLIWFNARQLFKTDAYRRSVEDQLRHSATHDALTGLANRRQFIDHLSHRFELAKRRPELPFGVLYLDLDGFKQVNDLFSHSVGDSLLIQVSEIFSRCGRATDRVARLGGDEFAILMEDLSSIDDVHVLAERILSSMPTHFSLQNLSTPIGVSIGIALYAEHENYESLLNDADTALYEAKRHGKGKYVLYSSDLASVAKDKLERNAEQL